MNSKVVVFDLDDTLYYEIDFLKSAFQEIAGVLAFENNIEDCFSYMLQWQQEGKNVFEELNTKYGLSWPMEKYLTLYRSHIPTLRFDPVVSQTLSDLKTDNYELGLITDGRSLTQRNKIEALGLYSYIDETDMIISEEFGSTKPNPNNYEFFNKKYHASHCVYVGDNPEKDFLAPNQLGWKTICLIDKGFNIHRQDFSKSEKYLPQYRINHLDEILEII